MAKSQAALPVHEINFIRVEGYTPESGELAGTRPTSTA